MDLRELAAVRASGAKACVLGLMRRPTRAATRVASFRSRGKPWWRDPGHDGARGETAAPRLCAAGQMVGRETRTAGRKSGKKKMMMFFVFLAVKLRL